MPAAIEVPNEYGYVILTCVLGPFIAHLYMSGQVMAARDDYDVHYPNLYATPGVHKHAERFNRIQRGHQNMFETVTLFISAALIGGAKYPLPVAGCGVLYTLGSILYQAGYADMKKDAKVARHLKGGPIKNLALLATVVSAAGMAGTIVGWWP